MTVLSVDLASRRYQDIGIAVIEYIGGTVRARFVKPCHVLLKGPPSVDALVAFLTGIALESGSIVIFIDGPQDGNTRKTDWSMPQRANGSFSPLARPACLVQ